MRTAPFVGLLVLAAVVTGCAGPVSDLSPRPNDTSPGASQAADAGATTPTPSATAEARPPGFVVPDTCDGLLPADLAASLATQGRSASQVRVYPDIAIGDPLPVLNYDGGPDGTVPITDYINCQWLGAGQTITIYVARVDPRNRDLVIGEIASIDTRIDRTEPAVISTFDGVIPGVGQSPSYYWVLRSQSFSRVDIDPGGEASRQLAQSIADQVSAQVRAD